MSQVRSERTEHEWAEQHTHQNLARQTRLLEPLTHVGSEVHGRHQDAQGWDK